MKSNNLIPTISNEKILIPAIDKKQIAKINSQLVAQNIDVYQINTINNDLESIFIDLTKK